MFFGCGVLFRSFFDVRFTRLVRCGTRGPAVCVLFGVCVLSKKGNEVGKDVLARVLSLAVSSA